MKLSRGVLAALVLAPGVFALEGTAKAELFIPASSDPWVLEPNCLKEGTAPGDMRCFSHRWMPESQATARRMQVAAVIPFASCDGKKQTAYSPTLTPGAMTALDLKMAYNLPDGAPDGAGKIVAVVDACGYSDIVTELNAYRTQFGIPTISECGGKAGVAPTKGGAQCIGVVSQSGTATLPPDDSNWAGETALDVQMISAACPKCSILVVQAKSASTVNLEAAIATAVKLKADAVSNSWGGNESGSDAQLPSYPGVAILAASGDADYLNQIQITDQTTGAVSYTPTAPNWPASDPNVLGVGGTTLAVDTTSARCYSDSAWSYMVPASSTSVFHGKYVYGGGSGCSIDYPTPSYQSGLAMGSCNARGSVDVSAAADFRPDTSVCVKGKPCGGIAVYGGGGWNPSVGTSAATPFMAGVLVRMGLAANANSYFYQNHGGFTDVTVGNNDPSMTCKDVMCNAGAGWDGPTGWGVPNGYELALQGGATGVTPQTPTCTVTPPPPVDAGGPPPADAGNPPPDPDSGTTPPPPPDYDAGNPSDTVDASTGGITPPPPLPGKDAGAKKDAGSVAADSGANGDNPGDTGSSGCACSVGPDTSSPLAPAGFLVAFGAVAARIAQRRRRAK